MELTPKAIEALRLLEYHTNPRNTRSAKVLARLMWPDKLQACGTTLRRGGYYRAAGGYFSKLQKAGYVGHWMDDFSSGYYLTAKGQAALSSNTGVER